MFIDSFFNQLDVYYLFNLYDAMNLWSTDIDTTWDNIRQLMIYFWESDN